MDDRWVFVPGNGKKPTFGGDGGASRPDGA